jgi:hypothetical protein
VTGESNHREPADVDSRGLLTLVRPQRVMPISSNRSTLAISGESTSAVIALKLALH